MISSTAGGTMSRTDRPARMRSRMFVLDRSIRGVSANSTYFSEPFRDRRLLVPRARKHDERCAARYLFRLAPPGKSGQLIAACHQAKNRAGMRFL